MLPLIILIGTKYYKLIYWRLQVTEFTKFINSVTASSYKHEFLTYLLSGYVQLVGNNNGNRVFSCVIYLTK